MEKTKTQKQRWFSIREVAEKLGRTQATVSSWTKIGVRPCRGGPVVLLQSDKIGGRYRIHRKWLRDFLAAIREGQPKPPPKVESPTKRQARFAEDKRRAQEKLNSRRKRT